MTKSIDSLISLNKKNAVITGGSGYIGREIADAYMEKGCRICLIDKNEQQLKMVKKSLEKKYKKEVLIFKVDIENEKELFKFSDYAKKKIGKINILINNAAFVGDTQLSGWVENFENQSIDVWERALRVNLGSAFKLVQILNNQFDKRNGASIINIGSIYGLVGPDWSLYEGTKMGNPAAYSVSKAGLLQLTRWLATTLGPEIRVNSISPGGLLRGQPKEFIAKYVKKTPLQRMGKEEDIKGAAIFLGSNMSNWITGQNIVVDGGYTIW
jgi:NAD(P)-dependent dehydrogenase (short-subunit alcohol dehydrogenase family)